MNKKQLMNVAAILIGASCINIFASDKREIIDIRKFALEFPHNKQNQEGNSFWHELVFKSNGFQDWSEVMEHERIFRKDNNNWLPNPLIENNKGNTARKEAKKIFKQSGNPITGLMIVYLRTSEERFLNKMALRSNREMMKYTQHMQHPHDPHK